MDRTVFNMYKPVDNAGADVSARADAIFEMPGLIRRLPDGIKGSSKTKLKMAEVSGVKVSNKTVADTCNTAMTMLGLPDEAMADDRQVHTIRKMVRTYAPNFTGDLGNDMTPLQATEVLHTLIFQKLYNPYFQISPAKYDPNHRPDLTKELDKETLHRSKEIQVNFRDSLSKLKPDQIQYLMNLTLSNLTGGR